MDSSRRSFDRSREPGVKRARMSDEPNLRDPRLLNSGGAGVVRGVRPQPADVRYRQIEREDEGNDSNGGGYHPTHQLFSELVSEYRKGLAELTVNSKPIITNLTIIAGENLHAAKSIAEAICRHIIEVPSEQKLPSLYLLDSIVKNIGRDYIKYFSTRLPEVFCKAYKQADPSIHAGLRHLFRTWEGVFPLLPLQMIEKELGISLAVNGSGSVSARSKPEPQSQYPQKGIHVNPKYLEARQKLQPPSRVKGPTNDISSNAIKSTGSAARLGLQHREPVRESMYEKDAEVAFDDYDFRLKKSNIGERDKHWYGTVNNMPDTALGQRNGFDGKRKLGNYVGPQSHVSRTNGGAIRSWKNNEEEEYSWDDMNSGVIKHGTPTDPRKDHMGFDEPDDMETDSTTLPAATTLQSTQSADYARVLSVTSAGPSSSIGRNALQPQMIRNPVTGALARCQSNNSPTIVQKRPPAPSRQPTLNQRSPSPSFPSEVDLPASQSMQRTAFKSTDIAERDNIRDRSQLKRDSSPLLSQPAKKQHLDLQKSKGITSSVLSSQKQMQQPPLPDLSESEGMLLEPVSEALTSGTSVAEAVQHLTSSGLFSAMLNSGVLSKGVSIPKQEMDVEDSDVQPPVRGGFARRQIPYKPPDMPSQANKSASVSKRIGTLSQTSSSKSLSKNEGDEKSAVANPYSSLLSTLMEKGLINSKNESSSTALIPNESTGVISKSLMAAIVPDLSSNNISIDNAYEEPQVRNLIGFEFKPSLIRQLHEPVIEDLSSGLPYRCNVCGLRLKLQERLDKHMEWHSLKELDNEYGTSRRWFPDVDDWVAGISSAVVNPEDSDEEIEEAYPDDEACMVPADENQCVCVLCGEFFEDYYSHEEDGWMFRGAMQVELSTNTSSIPSQNLIVHADCFSESSALELGLAAKVKSVRATFQEFP